MTETKTTSSHNQNSSEPLDPRDTGAKQKTKVAVFGLGFIGRMVFESIRSQSFFLKRPLELVAAVDIVSESCDWAISKGVPAYQSLASMLEHVRPDVIIHTTASNMNVVVAHLREMIEAKIPVVSSTEELFFPWVQNPTIARDLDALCVRNGVAVIGTGVNPGFIMDVLPAKLTQVCQSVDQFKVTRVVNASSRRLPLQRKIGVGLDQDTFKASITNGRINPVGLMESVDFLANHMGWQLTKSGQSIEPVIADRALSIGAISVKKGNVTGLRHQAWGEVDRKKVILLDLKIYLEAERPGDHIVIMGNPPMNLWIEGGTPGDLGAVSSLIRGIPIVMQARPGIVRRLEREHYW